MINKKIKNKPLKPNSEKLSANKTDSVTSVTIPLIPSPSSSSLVESKKQNPNSLPSSLTPIGVKEGKEAQAPLVASLKDGRKTIGIRGIEGSRRKRWENLITQKLSNPEKVIHQMIDFVRYPVITEKTYNGLIKKRQFTFDLDQRLTKTQIKALFESLFKVNVIAVNTLIPPRKKLRVGTAQGYRPISKRAIITLKEGQSLNFLKM